MTVCVGLPPELYTIWEAYPWRFGEPYCLFKTFLTEATSTASVLTISGFTVERYLAVRRPLRVQTATGLRRATRTIVAIWLLACVASVPYPLNTRAFYYVVDPVTRRPLADSYVCNIPSDWMPRMKVVFLVYSMALFVVPMVVIVCLYASIGLTLRRRSQREAAAAATQAEASRATRTTIVGPAGRTSKSSDVEPVQQQQQQQQNSRKRKLKRRTRTTSSLFYSCRQAVLKMLGTPVARLLLHVMLYFYTL